MAKTNANTVLLNRRKRRVRKKIQGTPERPRLRVSRTLKHIYVQIIDDSTGKTLLAESSVGLKIPGGNIEAAKTVGKSLAEKAIEHSIKQVNFDRGGRLYHGRVKALAEASRKAGLQF